MAAMNKVCVASTATAESFIDLAPNHNVGRRLPAKWQWLGLVGGSGGRKAVAKFSPLICLYLPTTLKIRREVHGRLGKQP